MFKKSVSVFVFLNLAALAIPILFAGCGVNALSPVASVASNSGGGSSTSSGGSGNGGSSGSSSGGSGSSGSGSSGSSGSGGSGSSGSGGSGSSGSGGSGSSGSGGSGSSGSGSSGSSGSGSSGSSGSGSSGSSGSGGSGSSGSGGSGSSGSGGSGSSGSGGSGSSGSGGSGSSGSGGGSNTQGTVISNVQTASGNWLSWGQGGPNFIDCSPSPCNGYQWSQTFGITSPSLSGNATEFGLGGNYGSAPYGDALFSAQLIGQNSPQIPDGDHTLLPTLHNFIYDTYFYVTNASITQVLEFDITMYMNGVGMIWGQQCNHLGDGDWDIWDNVKAKWVSAGVPCEFVNGWNHLTVEMQRESGNTLLYKSIALNGKTYKLNITYPPGTAPSNSWGVTANYQMDGNSTQAPNITYLDKFNVTYW